MYIVNIVHATVLPDVHVYIVYIGSAVALPDIHVYIVCINPKIWMCFCVYVC